MQPSDEGSFEPMDQQIAFKGVSSAAAVSRAELQAYVEDREYIRQRAPRGVAIAINHADPRQHRFAVMRMKLAGKTPENSPHLFKLMDDLKKAHAARGLTAGVIETFASLTGDLQSQHETLTNTVSRGGETTASGAMGSRKDQLTYGYIDSCPWDSDGNALGECEFTEIYGNMRYRVAQSTGSLALATGKNLEGDSFLSETLASNGTLVQSYVISQAQPITSATSLAPPTVEHPRDRDGNGATVVCLDRQWTGDCEYDNTGYGTLKVPLKGNISVTGTGMIIDWNRIQAVYRVDPTQSPGRIYTTLGTSGGGCILPASGQNMTILDFWKQVTVSPATNPTTMHWDLYTDKTKWANFSASCRLVQDTVYVTMDIMVPYINTLTGVRGDLPVTITNGPVSRPLDPPSLQYSPALRITNSCLAEGTLVAGADGKARRIEELRIGDKVSSPYASSLTITDTATGTERSQMVRIADARGRELLMTEMHPLYVVDRGMVAARHLRVGDRVKTDDGTSVLVRVTREAYTGKVFNLKVGNAAEAQSLGADQTAVYANGFLVGDGQVQDRLELNALRADAEPAKKIPNRWRQDYLSSRSRATAR